MKTFSQFLEFSRPDEEEKSFLWEVRACGFVAYSAAEPVVTCSCSVCELDRYFLIDAEAPRQSRSVSTISVVDLFSGCGGMSIGIAEAARRSRTKFRVGLAVDNDRAVVEAFRRGLRTDNVVAGDIASIFGGRLGGSLTTEECSIRRTVGHTDILVGGPPCQGHSDLNNHTRRKDPRNELFLKMARAAEVLRPSFVVIENVPAVRNDLGSVVTRTEAALERLGYFVATRVLDLSKIGVPQKRKRFVLLASKHGPAPEHVLDSVERRLEDHATRPVSWAISDLVNLENGEVYDRPSRLSVANRARVEFLFANGLFDLPNPQRPACHQLTHSYVSMYGRMHWDKPAQTITTGFGSVGQGRYVHPLLPRTITPHEAARIQTFPDWFRFEGLRSRTTLSKAIGNAVPPLLTLALGEQLVKTLK
jgi:DNA (cytosine-5)-methyltransferase 1